MDRDDLIDRYEDGEAGPEDLAEIGRLLKGDPEFRRRFVRRSLLAVHAHRAFAGLESAARPVRQLRSVALRSSWVLWAAAACILGAAGLFWFLASGRGAVRVPPEEVRAEKGGAEAFLPEPPPGPQIPAERPVQGPVPPREVPVPQPPRAPVEERPPADEPPAPVPSAPPTLPPPPKPAPVPPTVAEARLPVLESLRGKVAIGSTAGREGGKIEEGDGVRTWGLGSRAVVRLPDGSRLVLQGEVFLGRVEEKRILLEEGTILVEAVRQDPGWPLRVVTRQAEVAVAGTRFTVVAAPGLTRVEVAEGRVRLAKRDEAGEIELAAGQSAVAAAGAPLKPVPLRPPLSAAGLILWLRADAGVDLEGEGVARWADQSGLGRHAVQVEPARRPAWAPLAWSGRPALRFDGKDDSLACRVPVNGLSALTIILVSACAEDRTGGSNHGENAALLWEETEPWGWVYLSPFQTAVRWRFGTTQKDNLPSFARDGRAAGNFTVTTAVKDGSLEVLHVQGRPVASERGKRRAIRGAGDVLTIGGNPRGSFFPGWIAEVIVYARALPEAERQLAEAWLLQKYFPAGDRR